MMAASLNFSVDVGIQTDNFQNETEYLSQNDKTKLQHHGDQEEEPYPDSDESFGLKHLFLKQDLSSDCESSDVESVCPQESIYSSCLSTRRNSVISDSDLELPLHHLFQNSSSSSASATPSFSTSATSVIEGLDCLLGRLTNERFLELRRIQLGERPVTGSNARENLESFFHRAIHGPTEEERRLQEEANRPEHVHSDVQSLQQQSLVQSALQNDFRQQLENSLASRLLSPVTTRQPTTRPQTRHNVRQVNRVGGASFRQRLESMFATRSSPVAVRSTASVTATQQNRRQINVNRTSSRIPAPPSPPAATNLSTPAQHHQVQQAETSNLQISLEAGMQLLTESITGDLTRLQSLQVVSNMMHTEFRSQLEQMIQSRVETIGNGHAVQQFIQSLPTPTRAPQRDASHQQASQLQASINANTASEMHSLRQQLNEMKGMLAMSMELQMDTQRAIRQEVSAIFSTFMQTCIRPNAEQPGPVHPTVFYPPRSIPISSGQCVICIDRGVDTVFYQCGHMCACHQCTLQLKMDGHNCPMCRAPIRDVVRAYQTQTPQ